MTQADEYLEWVYAELGLEDSSEEEKFNNVHRIVDRLQHYNTQNRISHNTTGTITERLCELALSAKLNQDEYHSLPRKWQWLGDFCIFGFPINLIISVKSFKAKERLMASGTGNPLAPTVGFGLFDDPSEWSPNRLQRYLYRGFMAIYAPEDLLDQLEQESLDLKNINGTKLMRPVTRFMDDVEQWVVEDYFDLEQV